VPPQAETQADSPTPEDFAALSAAVRQRQFVRLLQLDQLAREMAAGRVFSGFSEGAIGFAPTFKVHARGAVLCAGGRGAGGGGVLGHPFKGVLRSRHMQATAGWRVQLQRIP
jgi:hypothetical protein